MQRIVTFVFLAMLALASPALAADNEVPGTGVMFRTAPGWTVKVEKGIQHVATPDGVIRMEIRSFAAADAEKAVTEVQKDLVRKVKNYEETSEARDIELAGMTGVLGEAKGKVDGRDVEVSMLMLQAPAGRFVLMITTVDPTRATKHEKAFADFLQSIKAK